MDSRRPIFQLPFKQEMSVAFFVSNIFCFSLLEVKICYKTDDDLSLIFLGGMSEKHLGVSVAITHGSRKFTQLREIPQKIDEFGFCGCLLICLTSASSEQGQSQTLVQ